jgi:hypothetical protein
MLRANLNLKVATPGPSVATLALVDALSENLLKKPEIIVLNFKSNLPRGAGELRF